MVGGADRQRRRGDGGQARPPHQAGHPARPEGRGREYLRIIYGPDYTDSLDLLRQRSLGKKRNLARREHGLGLDALTAFVDGAPLWQVHQLVFAILALESEPVDPRL